MYKFTRLILLFSIFLIISACAVAPITERSQVIRFSDQMIIKETNIEYEKFMQKNPPLLNTTEQVLVEKTGYKIINAATKYFTQNHKTDFPKNLDWKFILIQNDTFNARSFPSGKIIIYAGVLHYCKNENDLAVILAHEIAHVFARHSNEKISKQYTAHQQNAIIELTKIQEKEADILGLYFMAMAGYNPQNSPEFWEKTIERNNLTSNNLGYYPTNQERIDNIKQHMPKALQYYKNNGL